MHNSGDFKKLIVATAQHFRLDEFYVEKDYWITEVIRKAATHSDADYRFVFKGGTSLSKVYKAINRFSEDIDFACNAGKSAMKRFEDSMCSDVLLKLPHENRGSDVRQAYYSFNNIFPRATGSLSAEIKIESSKIGRCFPSRFKELNSYIGEYLKLLGADETDAPSVLVETLDWRRTFAEKIGALESYFYKDTQELTEIVRNARHFYDLHALLKHEEIQIFSASDNLGIHISDKRSVDKQAFRNKNAWLERPIQECQLFSEPDKYLKGIEHGYKTYVMEMIYKNIEPPKLNEIMDSFVHICDLVRQSQSHNTDEPEFQNVLMRSCIEMLSGDSSALELLKKNDPELFNACYIKPPALNKKDIDVALKELGSLTPSKPIRPKL